MAQITATITGVSSREVTRRTDGQHFTIYEIEVDGTKYQARKELAREAHTLIGKVALMDVRTEQKGQYTNSYIDAITPTQFTNPQAPSPVSGGTNLPAPSLPVVAASSSAPNRDEQIFRQTATKVAAHLSKTDDEFWHNVEQLIGFYRTGVKPQNQGATPAASFHSPVVDEDLPF